MAARGSSSQWRRTHSRGRRTFWATRSMVTKVAPDRQAARHADTCAKATSSSGSIAALDALRLRLRAGRCRLVISILEASGLALSVTEGGREGGRPLYVTNLTRGREGVSLGWVLSLSGGWRVVGVGVPYILYGAPRRATVTVTLMKTLRCVAAQATHTNTRKD